MRIGGFERAAVIDRLRTIPLTPRLKKTLSQAKKSKIYSGEKLENIYSSTSGYDPQPFVCDVQGWASPLRRPVWPGLLTRIVPGALLGRIILGRNPKPVGGIRAGRIANSSSPARRVHSHDGRRTNASVAIPNRRRRRMAFRRADRRGERRGEAGTSERRGLESRLLHGITRHRFSVVKCPRRS